MKRWICKLIGHRRVRGRTYVWCKRCGELVWTSTSSTEFGPGKESVWGNHLPPLGMHAANPWNIDFSKPAQHDPDLDKVPYVFGEYPDKLYQIKDRVNGPAPPDQSVTKVVMQE